MNNKLPKKRHPFGGGVLVSAKRVGDGHASEPLAILEVFAVENVALAFYR
jgi:hypothetical protein